MQSINTVPITSIMLGATTRRNAARLGEMFRGLAATKTQSRGVGNLPVKTNKYIEDFGARRETIEKEFAWDSATIRRLLVWGLAVPVGIYKMTVFEFDSADSFGGKPKRDMWGSPK